MVTVFTGPIGNLSHRFFEFRKLSQPIFSDFSRKSVRISRRTLKLKMAQAAPNPSRQQKVIITNKYGNKLVGVLHECGTKEIVILCHGLRSSKEDNIMTNLAAALENVGVSSFRFDFTGNGESEGSFEFGNYWREVDDLHDVAQHFHGANRIVIAIIGHSKGGDVVLLYASKYHDIKTVVNLSGRYDLKAGLEERLGKDYMERIRKDGFIDVKRSGGSFDYRVTMESLMDRLNTNMHEACLQIDQECRVLTVHGSSDTVIPVGDASEFAKIIPNHKLHIIEGADHPYTNHQDELASVVVNFIKEILHQDRGTSS
ncbi:YDL057W protein [Spatholobus suberectus]|nr:YDL057W protein [Spatholobus suberectus]